MISFCVITDGKRPYRLADMLDSIRALALEDCEINIAVDNGEACLGKLRNQVCRKALGDVLVVADDDLLFDADFAKELESFPGDWDVLCPKLLNPDGSRYWDWRWNKDGAQKMMPYDFVDDGFICPPGAVVVMKSHVFEKAQWRNDLKYYEPPYEDIEFSRRLHEAGYSCKMNPKMVVTHNDTHYTQRGEVVVRQ